MQINRDSQTSLQQSQSLQASLIERQTFVERSTLVEITQTKNTNTSRLNSLDVYRGLTMVGMIMVDNMGPYPPWFLDHAEWNGLTPADLIFPSFLFIMGMAVPLATTKSKPLRIKNIIRIVALFLIGVALNLFARKFTFDHFRILGILQRLSICYAGILLIHGFTQYGAPQKRIYGTVAVLSAFLIYISYMMSFNHPEIGCPPQKNLQPFCNFSGYVDRAIFGQFHMIYPNDPQGLFSNLSALFTTYIGYYFCLIMKDNKGQLRRTLKYWGAICVILGICVYPLTRMMPLNKKLYSSSFALLTSCTSGATLLLFVILVDILPKRNSAVNKIVNIITRPFIWLGRNPLFVFVFMDLVAIVMIKWIIIDDRSIWSWFYKYVFHSWITDNQISSVVFACFWLIVWTLAAGLLYRLKIFIRL